MNKKSDYELYLEGLAILAENENEKLPDYYSSEELQETEDYAIYSTRDF